ncbi:hypothetical protein NUU61_006555 [Penicillium alfredii]|uniref:NACHT domain-containing protein n=1 Tax=Penicillium alfredii TaxID=1506179 RepID=A0A9W9F168_9EURO|nr:uncharacterized protein NUU61_006555 [Penicillium alfredii]KAJ5091685.1 hypothetical protein NUU61_006555 [Penicillium alfredii]
MSDSSISESSISDSEDQDFVVVEQPDELPEIAELVVWLHPTDYLGEFSDFQKHLHSHVQGTGEWIEQTTQYQQWHDSPIHGLLWLKAVAGAGKSVLAARLIAHLQHTESNTPVLFFFFRQIIASNHDPHSMVRDWMAQLLGHSPHLRTKLDRFKQDGRAAKDIALSELWQLLLDALRSLDKVYLVVDALDEVDSEHTQGLLQRLVALGEFRPGAINLIVTSRPLPQVQKFLNVPSVLQVRLEDRQVNKDISIFVQHRLTQAHHLDESTRESIKRSIEDRVHPSFLYTRLVLTKLLEEDKEDSLELATVQNALTFLPSSMEDMYSEMLYDHSQLASVPQERQLLILQLVTHSSRPLRLLEIASVLDFLDMNNGTGKHGDTKNMTRMSCGPLLEILEDEMVSIIHHSCTEFLMDTARKDRPVAEQPVHPFPVIDSTQTHELMATLCVQYLLSSGLSSWEINDECRYHDEGIISQQKRLQLQHPFLGYALENWHYHVQRSSVLNSRLLEKLNTFMDADNRSFQAWVDAVIKPEYAVKSVSPLHVAAWTGITNYVEFLLTAGHEINVLTDHEETPLTLAAQKGHADTVVVFLKHGAAPDQSDKFGHKPIHYAARSNRHAIVQALLDAGVSPLTGVTCDYPPRRCGNARSSVGDSPLRYASKAGSLEAVRAMLPHLSEKDIHSSLCWAVGSRHLALAKFLLEAGHIDASADIGGSCLLKAAHHTDWDMIQLLISKGADPNYRPRPVEPRTIDGIPVRSFREKIEEPSLLHAVCASETARYYRYEGGDTFQIFEKCLDLALDAGCDVNLPGIMGRTALHYCVKSSMPVVEKLLQRGADVHATDFDGNTPLHLLESSTETAPILKALIRHGARWDVIRERDGKTPLHTCCEMSSFDDQIDVLRPYIKDWNIPDADGNTPLHLLAGDARKQLLSMGADVNRKNNRGETPLHTLDSLDAGDAAVLLAAGADIDARDNKGRTWFLRTVHKESYRPEKTLQKILDLGANLHAVDYEGNGALHLVCKRQTSNQSLKFLLKAGADPRHVNYNGDSIYHLLMRGCFGASRLYFKEFLELALATDAPATARNYRGQTLLHSVCAGGVARYNTTLQKATQNPLNSFPPSDIDAMIKTTDNEGRMPIHLAATTSEDLVSWLIEKGSDLTACTYNRQNLLHLAASADQSNTLGLLLESYASNAQTQGVINQRDETGQTPLHYACRSGRTESVKLLLQAGADAKIADNSSWTPLHTCAEFTRERGPSRCKAPGLGDEGIESEKETLRVTDIIRLLHQHGADIMEGCIPRGTPMELALDRGLEEMVITLAQIAREQSLPAVPKYCEPAGPLYLASRHTYANSIAEELLRCNHEPKAFLNGCARLLRLGAYEVLEGLARQGHQLTAEGSHKKDDFLVLLARWGFTEMFEKLGRRRENTDWINGTFSTSFEFITHMHPLILHVAHREPPSIDLLRVVVETFKADVNVKSRQENWQEDAGVNVLHVLACGKHWWHTEAIQYVLDHGADTTLRDENGRTPLHVAVSGGYRRFDIVQALLKHGANPNAVDNDGSTPLNLVKDDPEMFRLLTQNGADVTLGDWPVLYHAIDKQEVDTVRAVLNLGIDCNKPFKESLPSVDPDDDEMYFVWMSGRGEQRKDLLYRPLRFAAGREPTQQEMVTIVQMLLDYGADPFQPCGDETTIIHDLLQQGGILDPLLALSGLELEKRDVPGRTLLLAACDVHETSNQRFFQYNEFPARWRASLIKRLCDMGADVSAVTNNGNNVLHLLATATQWIDEPQEIVDTFPGFIEKFPALLHQQNEKGYKPFHLAAENGSWYTCQVLIKAGAKFLEPDPKGNTGLHHLDQFLYNRKRETQLRIMDEALALGWDINARNNDGETPLSKYLLSLGRTRGWWSLRREDEQKFVQRFRDAGADFFTRSNSGEGLLHLIARLPVTHSDETDIHESFTWLMEMGLDPFLEDYQQRTPVVSRT